MLGTRNRRTQAQILNQFLTNSPLKRTAAPANRRAVARAPSRAVARAPSSQTRFGPSNSMRTRMINQAGNRMRAAQAKTNARTSFRASGGVGAARWSVTPAGNYRRAGASAVRQR